MTRYVFLADLNRCVGCQTCTAACKHTNATAPGVQWRKVLDFETGEFPEVARAFVPVGCMHCEEPSCMTVCPSTATRRRDDGIVTIDYDICIGCSYCAVACPYQARYRVDAPAIAYGGKAMRHEAEREDPGRLGVAQKCTLCADVIDEGLASGLVPGVDMAATPACVASCIAGALHMGDLDDPESNVSQLLREKQHFRMHEELGNGPGFYYLYDGEDADATPVDTATMVADPVGLSAVSPKLQTNWDRRAAANFMLGGSGSGLFAAAMLAGLVAPIEWTAILFGLILVGTGLFAVLLEIGRRWRFLNVFRNARTSWMTREAMMAVPFFALGALAWLTGSSAAGGLAAVFGLSFLYCQAQILRTAKGIPAWRHPRIVPLIISTGLVEGAGLLGVFAATTTAFAGFSALAIALAGLIAVRFWFWRRYRTGIGAEGAPVGTFKALDAPWSGMTLSWQAVIAALALYGASGLPGQLPTLALAGLAAAGTGWLFKWTLVTKAAFNQGFAVNRLPARGAERSASGIRPGWTTA